MLSLYVDTAIRSEAEPLLELGIFRGVTTNPVLLQPAGPGHGGGGQDSRHPDRDPGRLRRRTP